MSKPVDLSTQDLALLTSELREVTDPRTLGIKLGIEPSCVTRILQDSGGTTELKVSGILDHWLKNDLNASWPTLVKALKEMNHRRLAEKLAKEHCNQGDEKVNIEYGEFLHHVNNLMKQMQVNLPDVKLTWSGYVEGMSEEARQASDITSFLFALHGKQGPYNYGTLSALLILFCGEKGEKLVAEYEEKLERQLRPAVIPTLRNGKRFIVKVDGKLNQAKELEFRNTLAKIFKHSPEDILLEDIHHGCTKLTYIIPAEIAESIQARIPVSVEELKKAKFLQLNLEGHILWMANSEAEKEVALKVQKTEVVSSMEDCKQVVIDNTTYSMVELPGSKTKVVLDERSKLLDSIDLRSLVQDLGLVGRCIQLAYHGMVAAGPECVKLQIEVQRIGYNVTRLCDKSAVTVSQFKRATTTILTDLQATYGYLLGGFEDLALETLSSVSDLAGQMAREAKELHDSFEKESHKVERVLEKTQETEADKEHTARQKEIERINLETKIERGNELLKKAQEKEAAAEQSYRECELKEDKAIQDFGEEGGFIQKLANAFTSTFFGVSLGKTQQTKEKECKAIKEKKVEALKMKMEIEKVRLEAFQNITDLTVQLQSCKDEAQFAKSSAKALHKAMEGLRKLSSRMMQAATFWKQMQRHCQSLSDSKLKDRVEMVKDKYSKEERLEVWTSEPFKIQAVRFCASWIALDCVCGEYMGSIKETRKELYKYIQENPTQEEAEKNVPSLAAKFQKDLQDAQKACAERYSERQEEIRIVEENGEEVEHD